MGRTHVLIESYDHQSSAELNLKFFEKISRSKPIDVRFRHTKDVKPIDIAWCDVLIDVRGANPLSAYVVRQVKKAGRKAYTIIDDDLFELFPATYEGNVFRKSLEDDLANVDAVITPSKYLADKLCDKFGVKSILINTIVEESEFKEETSADRGLVKILYAAGSQHAPFFNQMITPALSHLYERYGDRVLLTVIGPDVDLANTKLNVERINSMPYSQYREYMDNNHFDIGLSPLFDSEFCRSKYFNKYLEYSKNNICGIYSDVIPYKYVVKNGVNGILVPNDSSAWYEAICKLVDAADYRERCIKQAKEQILSDFSLESITEKLNNDLPALFSYKAPQCRKSYCGFMKSRYYYYAIKRHFISAIKD